MGIDEEVTLAAFKSCCAVIDPIIETHLGRVFGGAGDSIIAEFTDPVEAVQCATEIQLAVDTLGQTTADERRMRFRIGINIGDVIIDGENLMGEEVNIAARLESMAPPGGVCVSEAVHDQVCNKMDLDFVDQGERSFKNIARPVRVYRIPLRSEKPITSPYRGLDTFQFEHANLFFGRSAAIAATGRRLQEQASAGTAFLLIYGMSGAGKSSLLRAGLLPELVNQEKNGKIELSRYCLFRPSEGTDPIEALLRGLTAATALPDLITDTTTHSLAADMKSAPETAARPVGAALASAANAAGVSPQKARLVVAVDQLEEIFTSRAIDMETRAAFIAILSALAKAGQIWVVATIRADFYHRCSEVPGFSALKDGLGSYELLPPTALEMSQMIREPAHAAGLTFEVDPSAGNLADVLQQAAVREPGSLPLLEFVLDALCEAGKEQRQMTFASYEALGGLEGAIARRADDLLRDLPQDVQDALPALISTLTTVRPNDDTTTVRAVRNDEIAETLGQVALADSLLESRLLVTTDSPDGPPMVRLAHEALLSNWPRALEIVAANREILATRARVSADADRWLSERRASDLLLPDGKRLAEAEEMLATRGDVLDRNTADYIKASTAAHNARIEAESEAERLRLMAEELAEQERLVRDQRRSRIIAWGAVCVALIMGALGWVMYDQWQDALKTESLFLADLSHKETRGGDPTTGLLLALEALADRDTNRLSQAFRPHVPAAQGALDAATAQGVWIDRQIISHPDSVTSVAVTADGANFVTGSIDNVARFWDASTGKLLAEYKGHTDRIFAVSVTPDGSRVITGSNDGTARLWDAASGQQIMVLKGHVGRVLSVAITADGSRVITGSEDFTARVWDTETGATVLELKGHESGVSSVAVTPDGTRIFTGSWDRTARIWDAASGKMISEMTGHARAIRSGTISADGRRAVTGSRDETARLWDTADGTLIAELKGHTDAVFGVAITPDGKRIVTGSWDKTMRIWDGENGALVTTLKGHIGIVRSVAVSSNGKRIVSGAWDDTARVWDLAEGKEISALEGHKDVVSGFAMLSDVDKIVTASKDGTARVWENYAGRLVKHVQLVRFDGETGTIRSAAVADDGKYVVTGSSDGMVRLWQGDNGRHLADFKGHEGAVNAIALAHSLGRVFTASEDGTVRIWDIENTKLVRIIKVNDRAVYSVAVTPDGSRIVTGADNSTARLWNAANGEIVATLEGHTDAVFSVAITPDGSRIVTGSKDKTVRLWTLKSDGVQTSEVVSGTDPVLIVAIAPNGEQIVTGSDDGRARVWDADTGHPLAVLGRHSGPITALGYVHDGARIITGSADGTARLWDGPPSTQSVVDRSKATVSRCLTPTQRLKFHLAEAAPQWCYQNGKWPYFDLAAARRLSWYEQSMVALINWAKSSF